MKLPIAFLDANVLYSAGLRDLLMNLSLQELFRIKWTQQVHQEWTHNLLIRRPDLDPQKLARTLQFMLEFAPDSLVKGYETRIETLTLPDPDDRHILAAAITCKADFIVTFNLRDFPQSALQPYKIEAWHPDTFVTHLLDSNPEKVCDAVREHRNALQKPPKNIDEYLAERMKDGLTNTVARLVAYQSSL